MSLFRTMKLIKRSVPGFYEKGRWIKGTPVDTPFEGTAQPATGRVLELLSEGKRHNDSIRVFAPLNMEFTSADSEKEISGDIIVWEGRQYEVMVARPNKAGLIPHWDMVASREKEGEK